MLGETDEHERGADDEEALEAQYLEILEKLKGFDPSDARRILETLSDGAEWVPDAIASTSRSPNPCSPNPCSCSGVSRSGG